MFVNGTPSVSQIVSYSLAGQTITGFPASLTLAEDESPYALPATASSGLAITYTVVSGPATIAGDTLTLSGTGTVVVQATQAGNGTYAPVSETETITVSPPNATDTPTLPWWGVGLLTVLLLAAAAKSVPPPRKFC